MLKNSRTQELADSVYLKNNYLSPKKRRIYFLKPVLSALTVLFFLVFSIPAFAKPNIPDWLQDYKSVYPNSKYIAQRGSGDSAEKSKTDAISQIARYFQTSVNANLTTTLSSVANQNQIQESTKVVDEVQVASEISLFAVETTEPFYFKKDKKWYCVAFIDREAAWNQYEPQIQDAKSAFMGFYEKAENESEPFYKIEFYESAQGETENLLEKLEYGRILNPEEEKKYSVDREKVASIPAKIVQEKQNIKVSVNVVGDYSNIIKSALISTFSESGFNVGDDGNYICDAEIILDQNGENPVSIMPGLELEVKGESGKVLLTYSYKTSEKSIAYSLDNAKKKAFPKLAENTKAKIIEMLK